MFLAYLQLNLGGIILWILQETHKLVESNGALD